MEGMAQDSNEWTKREAKKRCDSLEFARLEVRPAFHIR